MDNQSGTTMCDTEKKLNAASIAELRHYAVTVEAEEKSEIELSAYTEFLKENLEEMSRLTAIEKLAIGNEVRFLKGLEMGYYDLSDEYTGKLAKFWEDNKEQLCQMTPMERYRKAAKYRQDLESEMQRQRRWKTMVYEEMAF